MIGTKKKEKRKKREESLRIPNAGKSFKGWEWKMSSSFINRHMSNIEMRTLP